MRAHWGSTQAQCADWSSINPLWRVLFLPEPPYYPAMPFLRFLHMTVENKCLGAGVAPGHGAHSELGDPGK